MSSAGGVTNALLGGWTVSWGAVLQGGQPITLAVPRALATVRDAMTFRFPAKT